MSKFSIYVAIVQPICSQYVANTQPICSQYVAIMQPIRSQYVANMQPICSQYVANMQQYIANMQPICSQYVANMQPICKPICSQYIANMQPICSQYVAIVKKKKKVATHWLHIGYILAHWVYYESDFLKITIKSQILIALTEIDIIIKVLKHQSQNWPRSHTTKIH